jgi:hypothetical protein
MTDSLKPHCPQPHDPDFWLDGVGFDAGRSVSVIVLPKASKITMAEMVNSRSSTTLGITTTTASGGKPLLGGGG